MTQDQAPDTIIAVCSAAGNAIRGVIRISGPRVKSCIQRICEPVPDLIRSFRGHDCILTLSTAHMRLPARLYLMWAPHSYTREDVVELHLPGNPVLLREVVNHFIRMGLRHADPGEFTKRAFLNGRIDLSQAEAVEELISASSRQHQQLALAQIKGKLSRVVRHWRDTVIEMAAQLELAIDFPEEDIDPSSDLSDKLDGLILEVQRELIGQRRFRLTSGIIRVTLAGPSNAGKSSLFNALLGGDRMALVSRAHGTTRDRLEHILTIGDITVTLVDTAGFQRISDGIAQQAQRQTADSVDRSQLLLWVLDAGRPLENQIRHIRVKPDVPQLVILNKCDLDAVFSMQDLPASWRELPHVRVSARTGDGLARLRRAIRGAMLAGQTHEHDSSLLFNARHISCLERAVHCLETARQSVLQGNSQEFTALDLREAAGHLEHITGAVATEDILNHIFKHFCIGK